MNSAPAVTPMVWQSLSPSGSAYAFAGGQRYAVLASVSRDYSVSEVRDYLEKNGWRVTFTWEQGQASRALFAVDDWLAALAPDTNANHRWLYAEADRTGLNTSVGASAPWPLTIYRIAHVFVAVPAPPGQTPAAPELGPAPSSPEPMGVPLGAYLMGGAVLVVLGAAFFVVFRARLL